IMSRYKNVKIAVSVFVGGFLVIGLSTATANEAAPPDSPAENPNPYDPSADPVDAELCKANLAEISAAISAYRREHKDIPTWLSALVPTFLSEEELICPVTEKTGHLSPFGALDPSLRCSYLYEFSQTPITA